MMCLYSDRFCSLEPRNCCLPRCCCEIGIRLLRLPLFAAGLDPAALFVTVVIFVRLIDFKLLNRSEVLFEI